MAEAKLYRHTFTVMGVLPFPDDMLRYDSCKPKTEGCEREIAASKDFGVRQARRGSDTPFFVVTLVTENERMFWEPTAGRWRSFSWGVVQDSILHEPV